MCSICVPTVLGLIPSRAAISTCLSPSASNPSTSASRGVRVAFCSSGSAAARDPSSLIPREQLVGGVRLDDVIVRSEQQTGDTVVRLRPVTRQEDDGELRPELLLQRAAHLVSREYFERDLENRECGLSLARDGDRLVAA